MLILHTSDWHLGIKYRNRAFTEDQRFFIDEICNIVEAEGIDVVLIAGDIYDSSNPSSEAMNLFDYAVTRLCKNLKRKVVIVSGNHDSTKVIANCSELLAVTGLYKSAELTRNPIVVQFDDTDIYMLPWFNEAKAKSIYPEYTESINSLEDAFEIVIDNIRNQIDHNKKNIIVAHAYITDSETSGSDQTAEIGFAPSVSSCVFSGFDYVALGHIHKPQSISETIRYSGTPMPYAFGKEEEQKKSVTVINTENMIVKEIELPLLHLRKTIKGNLEELLNSDYPPEIADAYLALEVLDSHVGLETLSRLKAIYPNLLDVSGKDFENDNASVTITVEELEKVENDPVEIFKHFCRDIIGDISDSEYKHLLSLFKDAVRQEKESC